MVRELAAIPDVYVLDVAALAANVGYRSWYDDRLWYLARTPLAAPALEAVAREHATYLRILRQPLRKVLALDLDNTLWGGISASGRRRHSAASTIRATCSAAFRNTCYSSAAAGPSSRF
jgi:predicted enzyme involved in methoxymalonyl-ACP biosynthesis